MVYSRGYVYYFFKNAHEYFFLFHRKEHHSNALTEDLIQDASTLIQRLHNTICKPIQENVNKTVKGNSFSLPGLNARFWV